MRTLALAFFLIGVVMILINPLFGFVPGVFLIVLSLVLGVIALLAKGVGAVAGIGSEKTCPECKSKIPADAAVCRYCGFRYDGTP